MTFNKRYYKYVVRDLYFKEGGNVAGIKRSFDKIGFRKGGDKLTISCSVILCWMKKEDLEINPYGGHRHGIPEEKFKEIHRKCEGGDMKKIIEMSGLAENTIRKRCSILGLPCYNLSKKTRVESEG